VNALRTNAVDMIDFVPWKDIDTLRRAPNIVVDFLGGAFMNLWFNATKPYNDVRVRQAFAYAIDRDAISKAAFFGHGTPIEGPPTATDSPFYNKELAKTYKYDPARAKALLAAAGYPNGFDFEFLVFQGLGIYTSTAQIVQANLKDVGINAKIQLVEFADLLDRKNKANYDVMIYGVSMKLTDPDAYAYYLGADSTYWAKPISYRDECWKLLTAGRSTVDVDSQGHLQKRSSSACGHQPWVFINFTNRRRPTTRRCAATAIWAAP
jgi:ABC-type transport system substrate-binding protein